MAIIKREFLNLEQDTLFPSTAISMYAEADGYIIVEYNACDMLIGLENEEDLKAFSDACLHRLATSSAKTFVGWMWTFVCSPLAISIYENSSGNRLAEVSTSKASEHKLKTIASYCRYAMMVNDEK